MSDDDDDDEDGDFEMNPGASNSNVNLSPRAANAALPILPFLAPYGSGAAASPAGGSAIITSDFFRQAMATATGGGNLPVPPAPPAVDEVFNWRKHSNNNFK